MWGFDPVYLDGFPQMFKQIPSGLLRQAASEAPVTEKGWRAGILQDHRAGSRGGRGGRLNWMGFALFNSNLKPFAIFVIIPIILSLFSM